MNLEIEGQHALDHPIEGNQDPQKKGKILYSRDFLLSLSELDVCKKLPSGFDASILSEFNDAFNNGQDRQRFPGSFALQSFRRGEYGSSPPTRGDMSNCSRGIHGRWDNRSGGRGDRDSDFQSNWDADFGRRHGSQSWQCTQNSEHDGLLGSGSFPRPSGYAAGSSAPKVRADDQYKLNRVSEPYHPPRPYKAVPHLRREAKDSYNDETFGSSDCTSQDRAEEERRRRDFELMRKEHRSLQEKQKLNPDQHKEKLLSDMSFLMEDSKDDNNSIVNVDNVLDECWIESGPHNASGRSYYSSQAAGSRPLVPPGFASAGLERNLGIKPLNSSLQEDDVRKHQLQDRPVHAEDDPALGGASVNQEEKQSAQKTSFSREQLGTMNIQAVQLVDKGEQIVNSSSAMEVSNELNRMSNLSHEAPNEIVKGSGHNFTSEPDQDQPMATLENLFTTGLAINNGGTSRLLENRDKKGDEIWSPKTIQSSKFAHWFFEDEKKTVDGFSSGRSSDLLSLIVGGDNHGFNMSDSAEQIQPAIPLMNSDHRDSLMTANVSSSAVEISEQLYSGNKSEPVSAVLTCEDLEQSILSEVGEHSTSLHPSNLDARTEKPSAANVDHASQHLLSLLQKKAVSQETAPSPNPDFTFSDMLHAPETRNTGTALKNSGQGNPGEVKSSGNTLTLESLFGSAFMKELQDSVGSARIDVLEPHGLSSSEVDEGLIPNLVDNRRSHGSSVLPAISVQEHKVGNTEGPWLGFDDRQNKVNSMNLRGALESKVNGCDTEVEIRLPEEESLFTVSDPVNASGLPYIPPANASNASAGFAQKLAALNAAHKDDRSMVRVQEVQPFLHSPYDLMEPEVPRQILHHQFSANLKPQMNQQGMSLSHLFDSHAAPHIHPHLKFLSSESSIPHNAPPDLQIRGNMLQPHFQHPNPGLSGFDPHGRQPAVHQAHVPGNFPPPDLLANLSRGSSVPPQTNYHASGFLQDPNIMQGFPFVPQNPNFRSSGLPLPAPDVGGGNNRPEALQRLLQMEAGSNPKQMNPYPSAGPAQGIYGSELEAGFRYR